MGFLPNTSLAAAYWQFRDLDDPDQPEIYINMNLVQTLEVQRAKHKVFIHFDSKGQDLAPEKSGARVLEGETADSFIADLDSLFASAGSN